MATPRSILVVRLSSLGDVLLTMPAVKALRNTFPEARLSWLVEGSVAGFLRHQVFIDRVIEFPRRRIETAAKEARLLSAGRLLAAFVRDLRREEYDFCLDFHGIVKSALLTKTAKAGRRVGFDRTFAKEGSWLAYDEKIGWPDGRIHKVERNMLLAAHLGARGDGAVDLNVPREEIDYIDRFLAGFSWDRPIFVVNPFCSKGSEFKRWDLANYGELVRRVGERTGATIVILWGPGEEAEARLLEEMADGAAILACPTTVLEALALLKRTDLYIGGDTGLMHLAALAGVPVVAVFGPTDHLVNGPYGEGHTIVRAGVGCSPCRDKECKDRKCLTSVPVEDVFQAVMNRISPVQAEPDRLRRN